MIVAAGLTPAWQQTLRFDRLAVGEVNRAVEAHWCGSGKVLNVGLALAQLGAAATTVSPLGGPAHDPIDREFAALGARRRWVRTENPTRVCTTILDASGAATELVENAWPLTPAELAAFAAAFAEEASRARAIVLSGSLPAGAPAETFRDLLADVHVPVVLDARGPELLAALACRPRVVKPNREELARTVGRPLDTTAELLAAMREMNAAGAVWVVATQGGGPVWATSQGRAYRAIPPRVADAVNPIGCGDCLAAGLAAGLAEGRSLLEALPLGMAAAAENLRSLLPARFDATRVEAVEQKILLEPWP